VPLLSFLVPIHSYPSLISAFLSLSFPSSQIFLSYPRSRIGKERKGKEGYFRVGFNGVVGPRFGAGWVATASKFPETST
jgi:hypothetical protein